MDKELQSVSVIQPVVAIFGEELSDLKETVVIVENNVFTIPNLLTAVHLCIAAYYVFNIAYPLETKSTLNLYMA